MGVGSAAHNPPPCGFDRQSAASYRARAAVAQPRAPGVGGGEGMGAGATTDWPLPIVGPAAAEAKRPAGFLGGLVLVKDSAGGDGSTSSASTVLPTVAGAEPPERPGQGAVSQLPIPSCAPSLRDSISNKEVAMATIATKARDPAFDHRAPPAQADGTSNSPIEVPRRRKSVFQVTKEDVTTDTDIKAAASAPKIPEAPTFARLPSPRSHGPEVPAAIPRDCVLWLSLGRGQSALCIAHCLDESAKGLWSQAKNMGHSPALNALEYKDSQDCETGAEEVHAALHQCDSQHRWRYQCFYQWAIVGDIVAIGFAGRRANRERAVRVAAAIALSINNPKARDVFQVSWEQFPALTMQAIACRPTSQPPSIMGMTVSAAAVPKKRRCGERDGWRSDSSSWGDRQRRHGANP